MTDETYNGWANRETWAFWLHVTNDQGWYNMVVDFVTHRPDLEAEADLDDYHLGESVVEYVKDTLEEGFEDWEGYLSNSGPDTSVTAHLRAARTMRATIGSWWRIDYAEIGAAARELVES